MLCCAVWRKECHTEPIRPAFWRDPLHLEHLIWGVHAGHKPDSEVKARGWALLTVPVWALTVMTAWLA